MSQENNQGLTITGGSSVSVVTGNGLGDLLKPLIREIHCNSFCYFSRAHYALFFSFCFFNSFGPLLPVPAVDFFMNHFISPFLFQ